MNNRQLRIFEKIKLKCKELNLQLNQDFYINCTTPIKLICVCKQEFTVTPNLLLSKGVKSCKCLRVLNKDIINARLEKDGISIVGDYKNTITKTTFKCFCGNLFEARPNDILNKKIYSCGDIHKHRLDDFLKLVESKNLTLLDTYNGISRKNKFSCNSCGKISSLKKQQLPYYKKCVKCRNLEFIKVGQIIKNNKIVNLDNKRIICNCTDCGKNYSVLLNRLIKGKPHECKYTGGKKLNKIIQEYCDSNNIIKNNDCEKLSDALNFICKCGNHFSYIAKSFWIRMKKKKNIACNLCIQERLLRNKVKIGDVYNDFTINNFVVYKNKVRLECKCKCGNIKYFMYNIIKSGSIKSCGHCSVFRNGVKTSYIALELNQQLGRGVHNYKTRNKQCIDIAFVYRGKKIAIEYDEWIWHKVKRKQDCLKSKRLMQDGWIVIRILAHKDIPNRYRLFKVIDNAIDNQKRIKILKSKNWKGYSD